MVEVGGDGIEDTHFMVMAGMGFDAAIMEGVNEDIKAGRLGRLRAGPALKSLMFPAVRVEVSVDGGEFTRHRARTVVVGNVGFLQAGMPLLPDAAIDDGLLDVVHAAPARFLSWIPLACRVLPSASAPTSHQPDDRPDGRRPRRRRHPPPARRRPIGPGRELRMSASTGRRAGARAPLSRVRSAPAGERRPARPKPSVRCAEEVGEDAGRRTDPIR